MTRQRKWFLGGLAGVAAAVVLGWGTRETWRPWWSAWRAADSSAITTGHEEHAGHDDGHDHAEHGHAHGSAAEAEMVRLTDAARANLRLKLGTVQLGTYTQPLVVPGTVVEQPGHCERRVTTMIPGVVTKIHAFPGQVVRPGDPLIDLRPTGDLLATAQANLLQTLKETELVEAELARIAPLVENGSIPARSKIEKEYEQRRLDALKLVQIQELLVRGLSAAQINEIVAHRQLLREFTIHVPGKEPPTEDPATHGHEHPAVVPTTLAEPDPAVDDHAHGDAVYTLERLEIFPGSLVASGAPLCDLAEHTELYLEGHAFERDDARIAAALADGRRLTAVFDVEQDPPLTREELRIRYIDNTLQAETRTVRFYVPIRNEVLRDTVGDNGVVYRSWRFKPGQKVKLLLPQEQLDEVFVVPTEGVVEVGAAAFVFRSNGRLMERVPVVVAARNPRETALRYDGGLFPGDEIALNQAYQLQLAWQQQQGAGDGGHGHDHAH
jgi:multidrug efflux pump subunit AcrA (membrane-fusion protein)